MRLGSHTVNAIHRRRLRGSWLRSHGFVPNGDDLAILIRPLVDPVERVDLTDGAVVRAVAGEAEYPERVSIHREVWAPSRVTAEGYALTRGAPGYEPELDLAVALPGGTFAAYCVCWLDPVNRVGAFAPVGARPASRRQGYGRAGPPGGGRGERATRPPGSGDGGAARGACRPERPVCGVSKAIRIDEELP